MALQTGTRLGSYEITTPLGAGGMGEVYRARDTRLDRDVAIKALPEQVAADPDRLARFEREAKVLATLNHPNVGAIYGLEAVGNHHYLVLEYIEGETLGERLKRGPIPPDEAMTLAKQMAEALEAAHEKGVIHRDLKPGNLMVTPDGVVKVLDFGLARTSEGAASSTGVAYAANSPTATSPAVMHSPTIPGVIMGTAGYMSPEQARGKPVDKRSDIFSFGCVLYEMLCGIQTFSGETVTDSLGAILHREPEWSRLPAGTPPTIQLLLRRCLAKDRNRRLRDIGDARIELENVLTDPGLASMMLSGTSIGETAARGRISRRGLLTFAALMVVVALLAGLAGWQLRSPPRGLVRKLDLGIRDYEPEQGIALSPDGRKLVYSANRRLWIRELDQMEPRELRGTEHANQPAWSHDSTRIVYAVENKLWQVSCQGGTPTAVGVLPTGMLPVGGLSWSEADRIFIATGNTGLHEVAARGGEVKSILEVDPMTEEDFHHASVLPGGRGVLFTIHRLGGGPDKIELWTTTGRKTLLEIKGEILYNPVYSPSGHIVYTRTTTTPGLWAFAFSLESLTVESEPFLVAPDAARPTVSRDGTLAFVRGSMSTQNRMIWVDRAGKALEAVGQQQPVITNPRISPDGTRIAVSAQDPDSRNIWIHDVARGTKLRLTFDQVSPTKPLWLYGSDQIIYSTGSGQQGPAWIKNADGSGTARELPITHPTSCSHDGKYLLYQAIDAGQANDIGYYTLDGEGSSTLFIKNQNQDRNAEMSPDGTLVVYEQRDANHEEIFLTTFPDGVGRWQVSVNSGTSPRWSPKGDEIFYIEVSSFSLMSVSVERNEKLILGTPRKLFSGLTPGVAMFAGYDVSVDAQRFLMVQINDPNNAMRGIAIVENWFEGFRVR